MASSTALQETPSLFQRHEAQVTEDGKPDVKYIFAFQKLDWNAYHRHRPVYPESMWSLWFDYHRHHGGSFGKAHDLGSGPGTAAKVIGNHFSHVFVSDPGAANLAAAKDYLTPPERFTLHNGPAEDASTWLPPASIDFSSICMCFHFMDGDAALRAVAKTLKPGGTLAVVTYGFLPVFPGRPQLEELWFRASSRDTLQILREGLFPTAHRGFTRAVSTLDYASVPADLFEEGVRRIYVNIKPSKIRPFAFVEPEPSLWQPVPTQVAPTDKLEYIEDPSWGRQADATWLREFLASCQLGFGERTWAQDEWKELESIINAAPGGTVEVRFPVSIILATRKSAE